MGDDVRERDGQGDISPRKCGGLGLLHKFANGIQLGPRHQIVALNLIRSQAHSLLFDAVRNGEVTEDLALQHHRKARNIARLADLDALTGG